MLKEALKLDPDNKEAAAALKNTKIMHEKKEQASKMFKASKY